jgi:hypothetical protein
MKNTEAGPLNLKLELISSFIADLIAMQGKDQGESRLLWVLLVFEQVLLRQKSETVMDFDDLREMKQAIRECGCLLHQLSEDEPQDMRGWYHGIEPVNSALAMANALSRMILEMSGTVFFFESQHPRLKEQFDRERAQYALWLKNESSLAGGPNYDEDEWHQ